MPSIHSFECDNCSNARLVIEGEVIGVQSTAVPEPASLALLWAGLGVIGLAAWRRRK